MGSFLICGISNVLLDSRKASMLVDQAFLERFYEYMIYQLFYEKVPFQSVIRLPPDLCDFVS